MSTPAPVATPATPVAEPEKVVEPVEEAVVDLTDHDPSAVAPEVPQPYPVMTDAQGVQRVAGYAALPNLDGRELTDWGLGVK